MTIDLQQQNETGTISPGQAREKGERPAHQGWLLRSLLVLPALLFALIALKNIAHLAQEAAAVGISLDRPLAFTILRIGFGGFPLGCALFIVSCLISRRTLTGFLFVAILDATVLAVRTFGMVVDGTVRESMGLIIAEVVLLALALLGIVMSRSQAAQATKRAT